MASFSRDFFKVFNINDPGEGSFVSEERPDFGCICILLILCYDIIFDKR